MSLKSIKKRNSSGKFPCTICGAVSFLHIHHIAGRDIPNADHDSNLCSICPNCHTSIYMGKLVVEGWVMTSSGLTLMWHEKGAESFTGNDAAPHLFKK